MPTGRVNTVIPAHRRINPLIRQLRAERIRQGLTVHQLSSKSGVAVSVLYEYEHGKHSPSLYNLDKWIQGLGMIIKLEKEQ